MRNGSSNERCKLYPRRRSRGWIVLNLPCLTQPLYPFLIHWMQFRERLYVGFIDYAILDSDGISIVCDHQELVVSTVGCHGGPSPSVASPIPIVGRKQTAGYTDFIASSITQKDDDIGIIAFRLGPIGGATVFRERFIGPTVMAPRPYPPIGFLGFFNGFCSFFPPRRKQFFGTQ